MPPTTQLPPPSSLALAHHHEHVDLRRKVDFGEGQTRLPRVFVYELPHMLPGGNVLRCLEKIEAVAARLQAGTLASEAKPEDFGEVAG